MPTNQQVEDAEDLLNELMDVEPLTQEELYFWYGVRREDIPRLAQAGLEREVDTISKMARAFWNRKDKESIALVRQIEARCTQLREWIKEWGDVALRESR